jgi:hypothetical protein
MGKFVAELLTKHEDDFKGVPLVHDEARMIFTAAPLNFKEKAFTVNFFREDVTVMVKNASSVTLGSLLEFANGRADETPRDAIQALEIVLGNYPKLNLTSAGRGYFDGKSCFDISDGA